MCTSLLYHTFGIRGYEYVRTEYQGGQVIFTINQDLKTCRCSACGAREVRPRGRVERRSRALPIGSRVTTLVLPIPRGQCLACGVVRQVEIPFADPRGALQAEAHGQQPRSLSFKGAIQTISRLMEQTLTDRCAKNLTPPVPVSLISCGHPLQKLSSCAAVSITLAPKKLILPMNSRRRNT